MNEIIKIKPHHFFDIIKLYGSGLEKFIPDKKMGHDFYKIGNIILDNKNTKIKLTIDSDDICKPCKFCKNNKCTDYLSVIEGYTEKDVYNKTLDKRIIEHFNLDLNHIYTSKELCSIYYNDPKFTYKIWIEEKDEITNRRYDLFLKGAKKYLNK